MSNLELLTDRELERMKNRSYWREARLWMEANDKDNRPVRHILANSAMSENAFGDSLLVEMSKRKEAQA